MSFVARCLLLPILAMALPLSAQIQPFTEEAVSRGIVGITYFGHFTLPFGAGIAFNDLDGDGDADCVLTSEGIGRIRLFENDGTGNFIDRTLVTDWPPGYLYSGVSVADYDGDGDLDLYISAWDLPNLLMRNTGDFLFFDVGQEAGVDDSGQATSSVWGDYDGDGWLDLYVCNRTASEDNLENTTPNRLFHNEGNGTFTEVSEQFGVDDPWKTIEAAFFDHDLDGDLDLYVSNDKGNGIGTNENRLFENRAGILSEISEESGSNVHIDSMGLDFTDFDRDGDFDLYVTNVPSSGNRYMMNNNDGTYSLEDVSHGLFGGDSGWACLFWDFDNNGWSDLFVANNIANNYLFSNNGVFPVTDVAVEYNIHDAGYQAPGTFPGNTYCVAKADIDLDGDLDLLVQTWNEPLALYINHEGELRNWLRLKLRQPGPNIFSVGALVQIQHGIEYQRRMLKAGHGMKSSSEMVLHFGLDDVATVDRITVRWPDAEISVLENISANQVLVIDRDVTGAQLDCDRNLIPDSEQIAADPGLDANGDGLIDGCSSDFIRGDVNLDGAVDLSDAISALSHLFASVEAACYDSCDANDDGAIDISDPITLLGYLFGGDGPLPPPFNSCGGDPTVDSQRCSTLTSCS